MAAGAASCGKRDRSEHGADLQEIQLLCNLTARLAAVGHTISPSTVAPGEAMMTVLLWRYRVLAAATLSRIRST